MVESYRLRLTGPNLIRGIEPSFGRRFPLHRNTNRTGSSLSVDRDEGLSSPLVSKINLLPFFDLMFLF